MSAPRILVLPGIGDIYWVMAGLQAFLEKEGITEEPEIWIWDFDGRKRSLQYVERVPFVKAGGYWEHSAKEAGFNESYMTGEQSVFPDYHGFDYYLAVNGVLRVGGTVEDALGVAETEWMFPLRRTTAEWDAGTRYTRQYGSYIVAHFSDFGMFRTWTRSWDEERCAEFVLRVQEATDMPVILTGSSWDQKFADEVASYSGVDNLAGQTNADEFYGLFRNASACVGWCGGNTILATAFKAPTVILWSRYFKDDRFYRNCCPPESWENWYHAARVEDVNPAQATKLLLKSMSS